MTDIYRVACEVLVEADSAEQAQVRAEEFLAQLNESEIWSSEVGIAVKDVAETLEYRRLYQPVEQRRLDDTRSYAEAL